MHVATPVRASMTRTLVGAAVILALAVAPAALAKNAPGNNGTVKIHDGRGESTPITHNDPHVGCEFHLHFLFGDDDQTGDWEIWSWPPTGDRSFVVGGGYDATGDGEDVQNASVEDAGHYKLFWGGDIGKHAKQKVFRVHGDCEDGGGGGGENNDT